MTQGVFNKYSRSDTVNSQYHQIIANSIKKKLSTCYYITKQQRIWKKYLRRSNQIILRKKTVNIRESETTIPRIHISTNNDSTVLPVQYKQHQYTIESSKTTTINSENIVTVTKSIKNRLMVQKLSMKWGSIKEKEFKKSDERTW